MLQGFLLLALTGIGWVAIGVVISASAREARNLTAIQAGAGLFCVLGGIVYWLISKDFQTSAGAWTIYALMFAAGAVNFVIYDLMRIAMKTGPNGVVWALIQSALIFPSAMGMTVFHVAPTFWRIAGIALIVASIACFGGAKNTQSAGSGTGGKRWLIPAFGSFLLAGLCQSMANLPSYLECGDAVGGIPRAAFLQAGTLFAALCFMLVQPAARTLRRTAGYALLLGAVTLAVQFFTMFRGLDLVQKAGAGAIGYPVMVGFCILGFFVYSSTVLREKIPPLALIGAILCLTGVLVIGC